MNQPDTKPYLIRAIYEWCSDCGLTPYLSVKVDTATKVPGEFVKRGEIVLNVSQAATRNLTISNDLIQFSARFNGVSREVSVPVPAVSGIFAKENGEGLMFNVNSPSTTTTPGKRPAAGRLAKVPTEPAAPAAPAGRKANLRVIK